MADSFAIGCSHAPITLNPPEEWGRMRGCGVPFASAPWIRQ
jgi:hypothetical protein